MSRPLQLLLVLALLVGSAVAFALSESKKLDRSPVTSTEVDKVFSPVCRCPQARARIAFRMRKVDSLTLTIVDEDGRRVTTIVRDKLFNRGAHHFFWDGRNSAGRVVPEGAYRPKVRLSDAGRTIVLPNEIQVDVTPPHVTMLSLTPRVFSPGGDGRNDEVTARYRVDERASVYLTVNGAIRARRAGQPAQGRVNWRGTIRGHRAPQGAYRIALLAIDRAGNRGRPTPAKLVVIRYIALGRDMVEVPKGKRFGIRVLTDVPRYKWRFAGKAGTGREARLRLRAPDKPGTYVLTVRASGFADRARVKVTDGAAR